MPEYSDGLNPDPPSKTLNTLVLGITAAGVIGLAATCTLLADEIQSTLRSTSNGTAIDPSVISDCQSFTEKILASGPPKHLESWRDFLNPDLTTTWCIKTQTQASHGVTCPQDSWNCTKNTDRANYLWFPKANAWMNE